jgi:hypothetical protein
MRRKMHRSRERNKGREGKIQKRVKRCKRKGKVLFMKIRNKREEEGENRKVHIYTVTL